MLHGWNFSLLKYWGVNWSVSDITRNFISCDSKTDDNDPFSLTQGSVNNPSTFVKILYHWDGTVGVHVSFDVLKSFKGLPGTGCRVGAANVVGNYEDVNQELRFHLRIIRNLRDIRPYSYTKSRLRLRIIK